MPTRYQQLREAIANLAAPADMQAAYLDRLFSEPAGGAKAAQYGNDELALEFEAIYCAVGHMRECREIAQEEVDAAEPLDALLQKLSGEPTPIFGHGRHCLPTRVGKRFGGAPGTLCKPMLTRSARANGHSNRPSRMSAFHPKRISSSCG